MSNKRILSTNEFYEELCCRIDELEFITDGLVHLYYEPSLDGRLFLVNSRAEPLGYKYEAVYRMKDGQVEYYKIIGDNTKCKM